MWTSTLLLNATRDGRSGERDSIRRAAIGSTPRRSERKVRKTGCVVWIAPAAALNISLLIGCQNGGHGPFETGDPEVSTQRIVTADWNDIEASLVAACERSSMAVVSSGQPGPNELEFEILTVQDEAAHVTARRLSPGDENIEIELILRIGRFGSTEREEGFLDLIEQRLVALRGVDHAPIRW